MEYLNKSGLQYFWNKIKSTFIKKSDVADYIVEQGTDGIWSYKKWSNGDAECRCKTSWNATWTLWTLPIYYSNYSPNLDFPFEFIDVPIVDTTIYCTGNDVWKGQDTNNLPSKTKAGKWYALKVNNGGSGTLTLNIIAKGKWK